MTYIFILRSNKATPIMNVIKTGLLSIGWLSQLLVLIKKINKEPFRVFYFIYFLMSQNRVVQVNKKHSVFPTKNSWHDMP